MITASSLITLLILCLIIGVVLYFAMILIDKIPMDATFNLVAKGIIIIIAILIFAEKGLPLIGINVGF